MQAYIRPLLLKSDAVKKTGFNKSVAKVAYAKGTYLVPLIFYYFAGQQLISDISERIYSAASITGNPLLSEVVFQIANPVERPDPKVMYAFVRVKDR